jgi:hypothetical protein
MKAHNKKLSGRLVLAATLLLCGCGTTVRTVSHEEATKASATVRVVGTTTSLPAKTTHPTNEAEAEHIYENPVYNMPIEQAWPIIRETLSSFCDGKLAKVDASNHHLEAKNQNVWAGDTYLVVDLKPEQQATIVEVAVRDYGWNRNLVATRAPHILSLFLERMNAAMKPANPTALDSAARLQTLNELRAKGLITEEEYQNKRAEILGGL